MPTPFDLTDQVAVITGSSRGIGRSIAETMASLGAKVVVSSRKPEPCEEVAAAIRKKGGEAIVIPCNISRKPEVEALVSGTLKAFGKIDILVCNAAVNPVFGPLTKLSDEAFDKIMGANVKSNFARALWEDEARVAQRNERTPLRRIGIPDEIGPVAAFLASRGATSITGQILVADG